MQMTQDHNEYGSKWDRYWRQTPARVGEALWDCAPDYAAARDLVHCRAAFDDALPVVDLGCGNGTQTRYLAQHFRRVIGLDVSREGIELAHALNSSGNLEYKVLDALDPEAVEAFHDARGDVNVYMRTVLHQMAGPDRRRLVAAVSDLIGERGRAFLYELSPSAEPYFASLAAEYGAPPPKLQRVFACGIVPGALAEGEAVAMFATEGMRPLTRGDAFIYSTQTLPSGARARIPAEYWVFEREP